MEKKPNDLIHESSPYLQQHAHNPVQWVPWTEANLQRAAEEDKPLLISIGYAACHWCHVMEHECFEDPEVAEVMNTLFIPIKVDREERPDVDQVYMDALQLMTGSGGWPLNVAALPDGKPFWGTTYLPKDRWLQALVQLGRLYRKDPKRLREYADDLTSAVARINLPESDPAATLPGHADIAGWIDTMKPRFDGEYGGMQGAPKFMMPAALNLYLHQDTIQPDPTLEMHVKRTLTAMAFGGLFDPIGGGFSRYSVDARWHVPHFEKMAYDNAQLLSLYARAFARYGDPHYRDVVSRTTDFLLRDLAHPDGCFYSSLDADSRTPGGSLEEGAYYTWREPELREALGGDFDLFAATYSVDSFGYWEDGKYVLIRREGDAALAGRLGLPEPEFNKRLQSCRERLLRIRDQREAPRLDDKVLTSWNGLILSGLADAWRYCGLEKARDAAGRLADYLHTEVARGDGSVPHNAQGGSGGSHGFLEDYACLAEGYISWSQANGEHTWMDRARGLCSYALEYFGQPGQPLLYFNSSLDAALIRRSLETADNVIPASNSIMAKNLFLLGSWFGDPACTARSREMLAAMVPSIGKYPGQFTNWMQLGLWVSGPLYEVAVCGPGATEQSASLRRSYLPQCLLAVSGEPSDLPLLRGRYNPPKTRIYICREGSCRQPLEDGEEALEQLRTPASG